MHPARRLAIAALFASAAAGAGDDATALAQASGMELFGQFCASCHGPSGRGDGPVAPTLKAKVPDLTPIGARDGSFPAQRVRDMIDGRAMIPAHGTREMPVWGYEFEARVTSGLPARATAQNMTDRVVEYLRSIQQPATR